MAAGLADERVPRAAGAVLLQARPPLHIPQAERGMVCVVTFEIGKVWRSTSYFWSGSRACVTDGATLRVIRQNITARARYALQGVEAEIGA